MEHSQIVLISPGQFWSGCALLNGQQRPVSSNTMVEFELLVLGDSHGGESQIPLKSGDNPLLPGGEKAWKM